MVIVRSVKDPLIVSPREEKMEQVKVVARFRSGKLVKGYTNDFFPKKPSFHVGSDPSDHGVEVAINDLKALFFVKDFEGNPAHEKKLSFDEGRVYQGRKAEITFVDGEKLVGIVSIGDVVKAQRDEFRGLVDTLQTLIDGENA